MSQMTSTELVVLLKDHFDEIYAIWDEWEQSGKDDITLRMAAEEWLRRQGSQSMEVADGRPRCDHGVVFPMSNCAECLRVKVGVLQQQSDEVESQFNTLLVAMRAILNVPWHMFGTKKRIAKAALEIVTSKQEAHYCDCDGSCRKCAVQGPKGTPTFSCRSGEYFKDGKPLDVLSELCELTGEVERYEELLARYPRLLASLEKEVADLKTAVDHWEWLADAAVEANAKHQATIDDLRKQLAEFK